MFKDIVYTKIAHFFKPIILKNGKSFINYNIIYETYGKLNIYKNNAILICHALNSSHHVAGYYKNDINNKGWWDYLIGNNKTLNIKNFFIICINNIGSCFGSTGPININPYNNKVYGINFPTITVEDWVNTQYLLIKLLNIKKFLAVMGGSLGGMQALLWSIVYPKKLLNCILIASTSKLDSQNIAFNDIAKQAIISDINFYNGNYYKYNKVPENGLRIARMIGNLNYKSYFNIKKKFKRNFYYNLCNFNLNFKIESYLRYQADKFSKYFDANTYLLIIKLLNYFDPAKKFDNNLKKTFQNVKAKFLIISFTSDWRFSNKHSIKIVKALLENNCFINYSEILSYYGHDSFLLKNKNYIKLLYNFYKNLKY